MFQTPKREFIWKGAWSPSCTIQLSSPNKKPLFQLVLAGRLGLLTKIASFKRFKERIVLLQRAVRKRHSKKLHATLIMQKVWRIRFHCKSIAIRAIQRWWRNQRAIRVRHQAALSIQSMWRGFCCKRRFSSLKIVTICCQSLVRSHAAQRTFRQVVSSVVRIQSRWRTRTAIAQFRKIKMFILRIQSMWRMVHHRRRYRAIQFSVKTIQRWWRRRTPLLKSYVANESQIRNRNVAATLIQRRFRKTQKLMLSKAARGVDSHLHQQAGKCTSVHSVMETPSRISKLPKSIGTRPSFMHSSNSSHGKPLQTSTKLNVTVPASDLKIHPKPVSEYLNSKKVIKTKDGFIPFHIEAFDRVALFFQWEYSHFCS